MRHIVNDTIVVEYQPASAKRVLSAARSFSSTSERTILPPRSLSFDGRALQLGQAPLHVVAAVEQREAQAEQRAGGEDRDDEDDAHQTSSLIIALTRPRADDFEHDEDDQAQMADRRW